jgi:protein-tyrosine phosphatase
MIRVLFVCLGNICRSPMADAVFQQKVKNVNLQSSIQVDSAGTAGYHEGETAHHGTLRTLQEHNIPYNGRSRKLRREDFSTFDYILAMDKSNLRNIKRLNIATDAEIEMFLSYANKAGTVSKTEVPDPYYDNRFAEVYDLVDRGTDALLAKIRRDHNL